MNIDKLRIQVNSEYQEWFNYVSWKRAEKRNAYAQLMEKPKKEWQIKVHLAWKYLQLWMSVTLMDEVEVDFVPQEWFKAKEIAANTKKIAEFDQEAMDLFDLKQDSYFDAWVYWVWIRVFDWWDDIEKKPITKSVDPLTVIPDPKSYKKNDFKYFGFEVKANKNILKNNPAYFNLDKVEFTMSNEMHSNEYSRDSARWYNTPYEQIWEFDAYDHYTTFNGKKYLSTWANDRSLLIRLQEIEPRTKAEEKNPSLIDFPIIIDRYSPIKYDFFGASILDKVWQYQDQISILTNLQMITARKNSLWPDTFVNSKIVDFKTLAAKQPGWRIIPTVVSPWESIANNIFKPQSDSLDNASMTMKQEMITMAEDTTWIGQIAFWVSPNGQQTKWEIQTMQKNSNQLLSFSTTILMQSEKRFWELWYKYYAYNFTKKDKKNVVINNGKYIDSFWFSKKEFISGKNIYINIKSKWQEAISKQEKFARLQVLAWTYLPNMKPWTYSFNEFMRDLWTYAWLEYNDVLKYNQYTPDEMTAMENLELLNRNEEVPLPVAWEDYRTYLAVYALAEDNDAKYNAIEAYKEAIKIEESQTPTDWMSEQWVANPTATAQAWNMVASEMGWSDIPSTQDVTWM